jgi:hypothetical protein
MCPSGCSEDREGGTQVLMQDGHSAAVRRRDGEAGKPHSQDQGSSSHLGGDSLTQEASFYHHEARGSK